MVVVGLFLRLYYYTLCWFILVGSPLVNCFLLLCSAFTSAFVVYYCWGFRWYLVVHCLVYFGGIFILFIFVTLYHPNPLVKFAEGVTRRGFWCTFLLFSGVYVSVLSIFRFEEVSHYLCSSFGYSYCFLCLFLMLAFRLLVYVARGKSSYFR